MLTSKILRRLLKYCLFYFILSKIYKKFKKPFERLKREIYDLF